jgi:hypothetical protein
VEEPADADDTDSGCCCRASFEGVISVVELIVRKYRAGKGVGMRCV